MVICKVCGKESKVTCICGFCTECIAWRTHKGCEEVVKNKQEEKK